MAAFNITARVSGFKNEYIDFDRGIRVGHLEKGARVTQIYKELLKERFGHEVVCDRWGRGVYWQWICWVPKPNRQAKPISSGYNFASAKFFISVDKEERCFQVGMQIERAPKEADSDDWGIILEEDWDWHVLLKALKEKKLQSGLKKLLKEGFKIRVGAFSALYEYDKSDWDPLAVRRKAQRFSKAEWGGFQLFYPFIEKEIKSLKGAEIIQAVAAVFDEVAPVMDLCMYKPCLLVK